MVMSYLQSQRPEGTIESYYTTGNQKKIECFSVDRYCAHCNTVFEAMGCYFRFCSGQEARASPPEEEMQRGKREHDELRRVFWETKNTILLDPACVNGGKMLKKRKMSEIT